MKRGNFFSKNISNNKGQVTVFIIAAVLIVGLAVLIYLIRPGAQTTTQFNENNPKGFIQNCLQDKIQNTVDTLSVNGGSIKPDNYVLYQDNTIEYLCYTSENYRTCSIQQPFLQKHIEEQIRDAIKNDTVNCFADLRRSYEGRGYDVTLTGGGSNSTIVQLLPKRIVTSFNYNLTTKKTESQTYQNFNIVLNNNLYELVGISNSIIDYEALYGDADTGLYMSLYPDLKVEKIIRDDGTTIYKLTDNEFGDSFEFASRSGVLPSGYGFDNIA